MKDNFFKHDEIQYKHLLGLPFILGTNDCFSIGRRIFMENTPIVLPDYARPNDFWLASMALYVDNFKREGFIQVDPTPEELQPFDVFLMSLPDPRQKTAETVSGHCAIYVGQGKIIHHLMGRLSEEVTYRGWLRERTTHVIRHKDMPKFEFKQDSLDLMSMMLPHKRVIMEEALENAKRENSEVEKLSHEDLFKPR